MRAGRWAPYAVAGALVLCDYILVARSLPQARPGADYSIWALDHRSYTDVLKLSLDHYLRAGGVIHPLPYVHDRIEYPVLLGFLLWLPSWLPGGPASWLAAEGVVTAAAVFASIALLRRAHPRAAWWLAASPALLLDSAINWDLIGIAFLVAAVVFFGERRHALSGVTAAIGTCVKLFPVVAAPVALAALGSAWWRAAGETRRAAASAWWRWALAFAGVCAVVFVPFLLVAPSNTLYFVRFNSIRPEKDSLWGMLGKLLWPWISSSHFVNTASFVVVFAAVLAGSWAVWRLPVEHQARGVALGTAIALIAWMAVNKIWNPQYLLWVFAAGAIASAPARFAVALGAVTLWDWWFEFVLRVPDHVNPYTWVGYTSVMARTVVFALLAAWCALELRRLGVARASARTGVAPAPSPA
jgi:hypothetical protein